MPVKIKFRFTLGCLLAEPIDCICRRQTSGKLL